MQNIRLPESISFLIFVGGLTFISYFSNQENFVSNISVYTLLFGAYLYLIRIRSGINPQVRQLGALLLYLVPFFSLPSLSPDIYRFIWDGELVTQGIHPYKYIPIELVDKSFFNFSPYMESLYGNMTQLSKENYSLYPSANQIYFLIPAYLSENIFVSLFIMRCLMLGSMLIGYFYLIKILHHFNLPRENAWIVAVNPFVILETIGNMHFEGVMLSWLFVGFYYILSKRWFIASVFLAIAINIKLTPLILLPFLLRYIGWKLAFRVFLFTGAIALLLLGTYLQPSLIANFGQSLELYFNNFQFNSSFYTVAEYLFYPVFDYKTIRIIGPLLSLVSFVLIMILALYKPIKNGETWFKRMFWAYIIYLLLATTVHPWYVILPFGLSIVTRNISALGWTYLIMLSYGFYAVENSILSYLLIIVEYLGLGILLLLDFKKRPNSIQRFLRI